MFTKQKDLENLIRKNKSKDMLKCWYIPVHPDVIKKIEKFK